MKLKLLTLVITILAIITIPLLFSHQVYSYFDLPKTIALYIFAAGLFLLYTTADRHAPNSGWLGKYINLYFIWLLFMALVSPNLPLAFFGGYSRYEGFFFFLASGFFFYVGNSLKEFKKQLILTVIITGAVVGVVAVWEFWAGFWSDFQRSSSTLGNPMILGTYFVLVIPACFGFLFTAGNRWEKPVGFLSLFFMILGTIFSFSRGGWGGVLIAAVLFGYFGGKQFWLNRKTILITFLICICAVGTGILMIRYQPRQVTLKNSQRIQSMIKQPDSDFQRMEIASATWRVFLEHPLTGVGLNGLATSITKHLSAEMVRSIPVNMNFDLAHNDLLHTLTTQGIPGLLIFLGLLFLLAKTWRGWQANPERNLLEAGLWAALCGYLVVIQFSFPWVGYTFLFWLYIGLLNSDQTEVAPKRIPQSLKISFAVLSLLSAIWYGYSAYRADMEFRLGFLSRTDYWQNEAHLAKAIRFSPWEAEYRFVRAYNAFIIMKRKETTKEQRLKMSQVFTDEIFSLLEHNSRNYKYYLLLGDVFSFFDKTDEAEEHYRTALKLYPNYYPIYLSLGSLLVQTNRFDEAESCFRKALAIKPDYQETGKKLKLLEKLRKDVAR